MRLIRFAFLLWSTILIAGCSDGAAPVKHKREPAFFNQMVNPAADFDRAEQKLGELKLLVSSEKYNMRYALFDNGKFYYQVDNLGNGTGKWSYRDGSLNLYAQRMMFDLDINLVATEEKGDAIALQFLDRHGHNTVKVRLRAGSAKPLRHFSSHSSGSL